MKSKLKRKKITLIILLITIISLVFTGVIVADMVKDTEGEEARLWFFEESIQTGQPVYLENAFIISNEDNILTFLYDYKTYEVKGTLADSYFGVADIQVEGEKIAKVSIKPSTVDDVLLAYTDNALTLKEKGDMVRMASVPIYKVVNGKVTQTEWNEMIVGVSKISCVMEKGVVCCILLEEDVVPTDIRVVVKNGSSIYYPELYVKKASDGSLTQASAYLTSAGVDSFTIADEQGLLICDRDGNALEEVYEGSLRIVKDENGLVLINELPIETYVKYVLPSEMPSTFGHEALKAQAVCARTYAFSHMKNQSYAKYGANLDDSTDFQAFHNTGRTEETDAAVDETAGEVVTCNGELIFCYYYSTSPGVTNDMSSWENENTSYIACAGAEFSSGLNLTGATDFSKFMTRELDCYDSESSFFRWKAVLNISTVKDTEKGALKNISVLERNQAGYVTQLELSYENATDVLKNENEIRKVLGTYLQEIILQNEQVRTDLSMIPSACFEVLSNEDGTVILRGGGFGHGIGMSQYGAKGMAEEGYDYKEIIDYYYENVTVKKI